MGKSNIMNIYDIPGNQEFMDVIYVVMSKDKNGEGIVSMMMPEGAMPLVFGHKRMIDMVRPAIEKMAKETGQTLRICRFKRTDVMAEIKGSD